VSLEAVLAGTELSANIVQRPRLGSFSWEGVTNLPRSVLIIGDELRPDDGTQGGAVFKFIPFTLRGEAPGSISTLADSPLGSEWVYAWGAASSGGATSPTRTTGPRAKGNRLESRS
jgi:hypothetical protein